MKAIKNTNHCSRASSTRILYQYHQNLLSPSPFFNYFKENLSIEIKSKMAKLSGKIRISLFYGQANFL
ncbi:hypothetical protein ELD30_04440 [Staphylococcus pseudintermedius]|nr:hypothetical protein [Staphylococcus pseudintermedius]